MSAVRYGECTICGRTYQLNDDGAVRRHGNNGGWNCKGSWALPKVKE